MSQMNRRELLRLAAIAGAGVAMPSLVRHVRAAAPTSSPAPLSPGFPEKTDLILLTDRPVQLETPMRYFREDITPNDAFFVRWHLEGIPTSVDLRTFRLSVAGHVDRPFSLSVDDLKRQFEPMSLVAVAQCSGNSRSFFDPRVAGGQWGNGAMGNAKWTGVPLRGLLSKAGAKAGAVDVSFAGLDIPPYPGPEKFAKSLSFEKANDGEVMVAYAMNDAPLPMLNGFPLRLVVPGWFATYWVKSLNAINVLPEKFKTFWMDKAYRIPKNPEGNESPKQLATDTVPISEHTVRSLFVVPERVAAAKVNQPVEFQGVAFDSGKGIRQVELSTDGGTSWSDAKLDPEISRYSFRRWRYSWTPQQRGQFTIMCRASNNAGQGQVTSLWNRSGYQRNVIEHVDVAVE
jgi:DMSO/TMAO reductase YedYZ molybdopterin-dependent catalytic subunit